MSTRTPLIKNGALSLTTNGDLVDDLDIVTQMTVGLSAYHCIYDSTVNSKLLPYLLLPRNSQVKQNTVTNIVKKAYQPMISANIISQLEISIPVSTITTIAIKIKAIDIEGNSAQLSWSDIA